MKAVTVPWRKRHPFSPPTAIRCRRRQHAQRSTDDPRRELLLVAVRARRCTGAAGIAICGATWRDGMLEQIGDLLRESPKIPKSYARRRWCPMRVYTGHPRGLPICSIPGCGELGLYLPYSEFELCGFHVRALQKWKRHRRRRGGNQTLNAFYLRMLDVGPRERGRGGVRA